MAEGVAEGSSDKRAARRRSSRSSVWLLGLWVLGACLPGAARAACPVVPACTPDPGNPVVRFRLHDIGGFDVELCRADVPTTVDNFVSYVNDGSYTDRGFVHRSVDFAAGGIDIIQGGGYWLDPVGPTVRSVTRKTAIALEYSLPNCKGTIAMARTSVPDSATSEWFFNVEENEVAFAPNANSAGYAVFGEVTSGMYVVETIAAVPTYSLASPLVSIPLLADPAATPYFESLLTVSDVVVLPEPGAGTQAGAALLCLAIAVRRRRRAALREGVWVAGSGAR